MVLSSEDIRLKVELSFRIKFYIKALKKSTLSDLRKLVNNILEHSYHIKLPNYKIHTQDGFEIPEMFRLGDILEDGQLIFIDPFSGGTSCFSPSFGEQPVSTDTHTCLPKRSGTNKANTLEKIKSSRFMALEQRKSTKNGEISALKNIDGSSDKSLDDKAANIQQTMDTAVKGTNTDINSHKDFEDTGSGNIKELENTEPVNVHPPDLSADIQSNDRQKTSIDGKPVDNALLPHKPDSSKESEKAEDKKPSDNAPLKNLPPKPDNFKGFVVRKSDFTRNGGSKIEEQGFFKPLKKRKAEQDSFEIL